MSKTKLKVTGVRYFQTRRGIGYQCSTNVKNVEIWNDGDGGGTHIPPHNTYTKPYNELTGLELENLINEYERIMSQDNGSKSSDAYDEERLQEENAELDSKVEWYDYFVDYVYKVNKNLYNDACEYADKEQSDD